MQEQRQFDDKQANWNIKIKHVQYSSLLNAIKNMCKFLFPAGK